jgi:flagellar basal-body rod protein FlgC
MSLFAALSVSASGMSAQRTRAELLAENLANAETTRTPEGGPYRRKDAVFATEFTASPFASVFEAQRSAAAGAGPEGVGVADIVVDDREPERRYLPGHPDADAQGYVAFPRVNPAEDMVDLMGSAQNYQANIAAISAIKDMIQRSMDLFR